jgi:hypothetical protein
MTWTIGHPQISGDRQTHQVRLPMAAPAFADAASLEAAADQAGMNKVRTRLVATESYQKQQRLAARLASLNQQLQAHEAALIENDARQAAALSALDGDEVLGRLQADREHHERGAASSRKLVAEARGQLATLTTECRSFLDRIATEERAAALAVVDAAVEKTLTTIARKCGVEFRTLVEQELTRSRLAQYSLSQTWGLQLARELFPPSMPAPSDSLAPPVKRTIGPRGVTTEINLYPDVQAILAQQDRQQERLRATAAEE